MPPTALTPRQSTPRPSTRWGRLVAGALSLGLVGAGLIGVTPAQAAIPGNSPANCVASGSGAVCSFTYGFTGGEQQFTVPAGITSLDITAVGAPGGSFPGFSGGAGAVVSSTLAVSGNDVLYVEVGGTGGGGSSGGGGGLPGFNGGGGSAPAQNLTARGAGGGGATDLRTTSASSAGSLTSRVVVAAGGGGAGGCASGGAAGSAGSTNANCSSYQPGQPGTATTGGAGGVRPFGPNGANGSLGTGGDGAFLGGGGGGGLYGGGGGAGNAGGGGGSSLGTIVGYGGGPSVTIRYTSPLSALQLNAQPATAVAGSTVPFSVTGLNAQGDTFNATSVVTLSSSDPSDTATTGAIRFSRAGTRTITATNGGVTVSQSVEVTAGPQASLIITPTTAGVTAGESVTFATAAFDAEGNPLGDRTASTVFTSSGSTDAVTDSSVLFTAAGAHTVTATDGVFTASAVVTVSPDVLASIALSTPSTTVVAGAPTAFTVTGADQYGNSRGDITPSALLTTDNPSDVVAGSSITFADAGTRTVSATVGTFRSDLPITVAPGALATLTVTPAVTDVTAGDEVAFTVTGEDVFGNDLGDLTASAVLTSSAAADTVTGSEIAFTVAGARTVTATVGTVTDGVVVTVDVAALASVTVLPDGTTATAGDEVDFTVTGADEFGNDLGDVTADAIFTTGDADDVVDGATIVFATAGARTVTAAVGAVTGDAQLTVVAGDLASLVLTQGTTPVRAGVTVGFTVTGADEFGNDLGDLTASALFESDESTDEVDGATLTATRAGSRTISAAVGQVSGELLVEVVAGQLASVTLAPTASTLTAGGAFGFSVLGEDEFGNALGDVSADAVLTSDNATDLVDGTRVTFRSTGARTLTATVAGVSDTLAVIVVAAPVPPAQPTPIVPPVVAAAAAPTPSGLAATGGDAIPTAALGLLAMLAGLALLGRKKLAHE